jgi:hypothetical protein
VRRPLVLLAALAALTPATAGAKDHVSKVVTYITTYTGHYNFVELRKDVDYAGRTTVSTQNQGYTWQQEVKDVVVPRSNGTVKETRYTTVDASGDYDGGYGTSPPRHCEYSSSPGKVFRSKVPGNPEGFGPVHGNPLIPYSWTLPQFPGQLGVTSTCGPEEGGLLAFAPENTSTIGAPIKLTTTFDQAFTGSDAVRFKSMPDRHSIDDASIPLGTQQLPNGGYDSAQVTLTGGIEFARWGDPRNKNKVGNLLLHDLLDAWGVKASASGSPEADGDNDTILVPGMAPGTVTTSVSATVTWGSSPRARAATAQQTTIYTGKATIKGDDSVTISLKPTAAGIAALAVSHPSTAITLKATFNPSGKGRNTTVTRTGTLGARLG